MKFSIWQLGIGSYDLFYGSILPGFIKERSTFSASADFYIIELQRGLLIQKTGFTEAVYGSRTLSTPITHDVSHRSHS
jgi:hypothetical protein